MALPLMPGYVWGVMLASGFALAGFLTIGLDLFALSASPSAVSYLGVAAIGTSAAIMFALSLLGGD